ncbi:MAG: hypothetical protein IJ362_02285, partial [Oscillospiraceae bacterium]|nr:hypothetical protein [Oscillospiraceae bacterium]
MKNFKRFMAVILAVILSFSLVGCSKDGVADDGTNTELVRAINASGKYLTKKITAPKYGDENAIVALNRSTYIDYWHNRTTNYVNKVNHDIRLNGGYVGSDKELVAEDYPEVIYAITASGIYANWASAQDLIRGISIDNVVMMGGYLNKVDALTALECGKYTPYETGDLSRQDLIDFAMELQKADGSFTYTNMGEVSTLEVTASAVTGLALTGEEGDVAASVNSGVEYLIANVNEDVDPEVLVKTIIALNTVGIDATDVEGKDLIAAIMKYARDDGSFSFDTTAKKGNKSDTSIAMLALASQYRFKRGMTSLYDMTDVLGGTHNQLSPEWLLNVRLMAG